MKQRLTCPGSSATVPAHHIALLLLLGVLCCSRAHSKVIQTKRDLPAQHDLHPKKHSVEKSHLLQKLKNYLDHTVDHNKSVHQIKKHLDRKEDHSPLSSDHHRAIVEDFKAKILRHLGLSAPPPVSSRGRFNASVGRQIREFMRNVHLGEADHPHDSGHDSSGVNKTETFIFHATGSIAHDAVSDTRRPKLALRTLQFNTHFHQPEVPYLDLVMKSALLRMRISVQKNLLDREKNVPPTSVTVSLSIKRISDTENTPKQDSRSIFVGSFPVHLQTISVEIPLSPDLLSHLVDLQDQQIVFTVAIGNEDTASDSIAGDLNDERDFTSIALRPGYNLTRRARRLTQLVPGIAVSHAVLEVSTVTKDLRRSRGKRQAKEPSCQDNLCCRNSIYITFKEIGWDDWVLAPDGYTAYFCKGDCPHRYKSASTFSGIKGLLHLRKPSVVPGPTCAASGYTYLTLLHYDEDDELVSTNYPEMVVTGCRCY